MQAAEDPAGAEDHRRGGGLATAGQASACCPLSLEPAAQLGALDLPEDSHAGPVIIVTKTQACTTLPLK